MAIARREMYGGAISLEIPDHFVDVSTIRPLNDNQVLLSIVTSVLSNLFSLFFSLPLNGRNVGLTLKPTKVLWWKFLSTMKT